MIQQARASDFTKGDHLRLALKPVPDIPVTPVHSISQINVNENYDKDHERYSAVDKKIYRR